MKMKTVFIKPNQGRNGNKNIIIYLFAVIFLVMCALIAIATIYASKGRRDKKLCIEKQESSAIERM